MTIISDGRVDATAGDPGPDATPHIETFDPRSGVSLGRVPDRNAIEVGEAVVRARVAFDAWGGLAFDERREHILSVRDLLLDRLGRIVAVITSETGKLDAEAVFTEIMTACETIQYYAKHGERALRPQKVSAGLMSHKRAERSYEPLGVVGVISPWNYPFILAMTTIITALFAGNADVLKPSEVTPLVGVAIGGLFADVGGHPDLVQVVTGGGATGEALVRSGVQKICFTGSVRTGKRVMAAASDTLTPVLLELGGKDPMIVCADADLDRAPPARCGARFRTRANTVVHPNRFTESPRSTAIARRTTSARCHRLGDRAFGVDIHRLQPVFITLGRWIARLGLVRWRCCHLGDASTGEITVKCLAVLPTLILAIVPFVSAVSIHPALGTIR